MNLIFTKFWEQLGKNNLDWETAVIRGLLERDTSTYVPDVDHDFLDSFTGGGGVEISVASYARQTLTSGQVNLDDPNDRTEFDAGNIAFGSLESGQTVKSLILYQQIGGDDLTPADDVLIARIDGKIQITLAADALLNATTIWVEPLDEALASGAAVDFGGGATATLSSAASADDRSLSITALAAAATAGATSETVTANSLFPAILGGGPFNANINAEGLLQIIR